MINARILADEIGVIIQQAGEAIMTIYQQEDEVEIIHKVDESPVTVADKMANDIILTGLATCSFQAPVISEESILPTYEERQRMRYFWLVDPLDGTKEFIKKNGEFTVNIALVDGQETIFGVVLLPATGVWYWAAKGEGAFRISRGEVQKISVNTFQRSDTGLRVVASRSHTNTATLSYIDALEAAELIRKGSALKLLMIAEGAADLYPRFAPTMAWDIAAAQIIIEEAGGKLLRIDTAKPLRYDKENLVNPHFLAQGNER